MSNSDSEKYSVGYKKPPRHSQFKPGKSGNPLGRPKKGETFSEIVDQELREPVTMTRKNGRQKRISSLRAIVKRRIHKALKGDDRAEDKVLDLARAHQPVTGDNLAILVQEMRATHARHLAAEPESVGNAETLDHNRGPEQ